ncbi:MAG: bifunctional adenosylcobinamide kinase/adenosylcobinamide-phosphate guanylyltransferase [Ilumatobacteraceae bacterium]
MLTLLVGGVRSGKSTRALRLAERSGSPVVFIATAERIDTDMDERIDRHRLERPDHWLTVEEPLDLGAAIRAAAAEATVVVDCLTVWMANLLHHVADESARAAMVDNLLAALDTRTATTVVVSNEVGMGIHPETELGRVYRDDLGRVNQRVASIADEVVLCVAGRTLRLDPPD